MSNYVSQISKKILRKREKRRLKKKRMKKENDARGIQK